MSLTIRQLKRKNKEVRKFFNREWKMVHKEHFGTDQDETLWKKIRFIFKASEGKEIVGAMDGDIMAGVMLIDQLIVSKDLRRAGIGRRLIEHAMEFAEKHKIHKIYLYTGSDWQSVGFYKKLGFKKETTIKNMYEKKDFIFMSKEI